MVHSLAIKANIANNISLRNGGAILNITNGHLALLNTTLSGNSAAGNGGGIANIGNPIADLNNVTIAQNSATISGGGIQAGGTVNMANTIIATNPSPSGSPDCVGTVTSRCRRRALCAWRQPVVLQHRL